MSRGFGAAAAWLVSALAAASPLPGPAAGHPQVGDMLVAARDLRDPSFENSVVLLIGVDHHGARGVIVNRPLDVRPAEALPDVKGLRSYEEPLFAGGPLERDHFAILVRGDTPPDGTRRIVDGVNLGSEREVLERLARRRATRNSFRIYAGHAGWAPGQLAWEVDRGAWHLVPGAARVVFSDDPAGVWGWLVPGRREDRVELRRLPAVVAAVAASAAAPASAPASAASGSAWRTVAGLVDLDRPAVELRAVELFPRLVGVGVIGEGDEAEAARAAGLAVHDDRGFGDLAELLECLAQPVLRGVPTDSADE